MSYWMENATQPGKHFLLDCGPWSSNATRDRFDALLSHISLRNFERVGNDRLVAKIPKNKLEAVLAAMPEIQAGRATYCWCTHGFVTKGQQ